jgi:hypothetical protein
MLPEDAVEEEEPEPPQVLSYCYFAFKSSYQPLQPFEYLE